MHWIFNLFFNFIPYVLINFVIYSLWFVLTACFMFYCRPFILDLISYIYTHKLTYTIHILLTRTSFWFIGLKFDFLTIVRAELFRKQYIYTQTIYCTPLTWWHFSQKFNFNLNTAKISHFAMAVICSHVAFFRHIILHVVRIYVSTSVYRQLSLHSFHL